MPWTVSDVDSKKKGLTPSQKKKWVKIANGVLKKCQSEGGSDCEGKAIRIANSNFSMERKMEKIPKGALRFVDTGCHVFAKKEEGKPTKIDMTMYSGGIIKNHFYWGDLVFDLDGMAFPDVYPILEEHQQNKKIGFSNGPPEIKDGKLKVNADKAKFVSTDESEEFQRLSAEGFPYQASIYAIPSVIESVEEGASVEVNGFEFKGPGTVWRKSMFQEASVAVFGWDNQTKSSVFSRTETEDIEYEKIKEATDDSSLLMNKPKTDKEVKIMDLKELREKHPELLDEFKKEVIAEVKAEHAKELKKKDEEFSQQKTALEGRVEKLEETNLELQKENTMRTEREQMALADKIWDDKLASSDIAEHLFHKVRVHVTYKKHMKDGLLDEESFSKAVDDEIEDWTKMGTTASVLGSGFSNSRREDESEEEKKNQMAKESDDISNRMLESVGNKPKKED